MGSLGLDLGVISPTLFAMMVLMAIVTTVGDTPILHLLMPQQAARDEFVNTRTAPLVRPEVRLRPDTPTA